MNEADTWHEDHGIRDSHFITNILPLLFFDFVLSTS